MLQAAKEKPEVLGFVTPEADRVYVQLMWVIPADTPNAELAEVGDRLPPEQGRAGGAGPPRGGHVARSPRRRKSRRKTRRGRRPTPSTEEQFRAMRYYPYEAYFKDWDGIRKVWEEEVLRKG